MGIFSFLKKKNETATTGAGAFPRPDSPLPHPNTRMPLDTEADRERQRAIARATAAKIDEIELEMASDIFDDDAWGKPRRTPAVAASAPVAELDTDVLLGPEDVPDAAAPASSASIVEEAAILYASGQLDAAEQALRASLAEAGPGERLPWWMLFDLYQVQGREQDFESVAIDYASHFETSPPPYLPPHHLSQQPAAGQAFAGATPTASLSGRLDEGIAAPLAHVLAPSSSPVVRVEFHAITAATPEGSALLLDALQRLRRAGREIVLAGADQLLAVLRPMLAIGERTAGQAPWLLLLELLLLANREKDFEETAMDFCVTFEVSPPSFEAPAHAAVNVAASPARAGDRFLLPGVVEGDSNALLAAIGEHAGRHQDLVLDCSRLARIDYGSASVLITRLRQLADEGHGVELRDLNHLVAALLRLLGVATDVRLYTHKY